MQEHIEKQNERNIKLAVENIVTDSISNFIDIKMDKLKIAYEAKQSYMNERIEEDIKRRRIGINYDESLLRQEIKEVSDFTGSDVEEELHMLKCAKLFKIVK